MTGPDGSDFTLYFALSATCNKGMPQIFCRSVGQIGFNVLYERISFYRGDKLYVYVSAFGFVKSTEALIGHDGTKYYDYYVYDQTR